MRRLLNPATGSGRCPWSTSEASTVPGTVAGSQPLVSRRSGQVGALGAGPVVQGQRPAGLQRDGAVGGDGQRGRRVLVGAPVGPAGGRGPVAGRGAVHLEAVEAQRVGVGALVHGQPHPAGGDRRGEAISRRRRCRRWSGTRWSSVFWSREVSTTKSTAQLDRISWPVVSSTGCRRWRARTPGRPRWLRRSAGPSRPAVALEVDRDPLRVAGRGPPPAAAHPVEPSLSTANCAGSGRSRWRTRRPGGTRRVHRALRPVPRPPSSPWRARPRVPCRAARSRGRARRAASSRS